MFRKLAFVSIFAFSGCGLWPIDEVPPPNNDISVELYLSRASMNGPEFEQYKLLPVGLFSECGTMKRGRPESKNQSIHVVAEGVRENLRTIASNIFDRMQRRPLPNFDPPGDNANMFDPGKYFLTVRRGTVKVELKTSLDSVQHANGTTQALLKQLAEHVRGAAEHHPCNNIEFFGLGGRKR